MNILKTTIKTLSGLIHAASSDPTRLALTGIELRKQKNGIIRMTACDGHILVRVFIQDLGLFDQLDERSVLIGKTEIKRLELDLKAAGRFSETIEVLSLGGKELDGISFPNVELMIPSSLDAYTGSNFGVNLDLLTKVSKALSGVAAKLPVVSVKAKDNSSALVLRLSSTKDHCPDHVCLVMPCKVEL